MVHVEPRRHVCAIGISVGKIFNVAADEPVKTVLHALTGKVAGVANANTCDELVVAAVMSRRDHLITQRGGELINTPGRHGIAQRQNAVIKQRNPPVRKYRSNDYLLGAKVIDGATTAKKVIAEGDVQVAFDERGQLRR